jgi:glycosyltransferase involved in cell wall biosynthesis
MQHSLNILNPKVILFSGRLLPSSETFIRAQGEGLHKFTPYYVGSRLVKGLSLPSERTFVVNQGGTLGAAQEILFKFLGSAPKLYQQVQQLNPVLIHAHFGLNGALALPLARTFKLPLVVTFHGSDATTKDEYVRKTSISHRIYFRRREALKREARLFIAVSEFIREKLLEQGFPSDKVVVHSIGVNTEVFQADQSVPREPVVLFVGRLAQKKGCEYLIQAMAKVQAQMPEVELAIVGDGPLRLKLEDLAAKSLKRYKFLGLQPPEVVKSWMNRSLILAAPSVTAPTGDSEGLPTVVVEAQAMGLPVVGSIHAGIPQAVVHGETGFLAAERDWKSLAEYILRLLQHPMLWQSFSRNGQQRMRNLFDLHKQTQALEGIYEAVLQEQVQT